MVPPSPTAANSREGGTIPGDPSPAAEGEITQGESQSIELTAGNSSSTEGETSTNQNNNAEISTKGEQVEEELSKEIRAAIMVIAILVTTVTYQAILNPPGGFWQDDLQSLNSTVQNHTAGNPVMATKDPLLYGAFVAVNSAAFAASFIVMGLSLRTLGVRFESLFLNHFRKVMNIPSSSTRGGEQKNFPKGRNISSNSTAVVDEINNLMTYVQFAYFCLLIALSLSAFLHLTGPGLVVFFIAYASIILFGLALVFIPRLYQMWKICTSRDCLVYTVLAY